jgi:hypothetical protein
MTGVIGHVENGTVRLTQSVDWSEGQEVLVIALPARPVQGEAPPTELLEEDAREFAVRRETLGDVNRRELA